MSEFNVMAAYDDIDQMEAALEQIGPNPISTKLVDPRHPYTIEELKTNLQWIGSCLSSLHAIKGKITGRAHALKESVNNAVDQTMVGFVSEQNSVTGKRAEILSTNTSFSSARELQINQESRLELVSGWVRAYTTAWETMSRMITEQLGEAEHITGKLP